MSAYMNSYRHIDFLVDALRHWDVGWWHDGEWHKPRLKDPDEIGSVLVTANLASVSFRYPNDRLDQLPGSGDQVDEYHHRGMSRFVGLTPMNVLAAVKGFQYQSVDDPGWDDSEAKAMTERLKDEAISRLLDGTDSARCWEIHEGMIPERYRRTA